MRSAALVGVVVSLLVGCGPMDHQPPPAERLGAKDDGFKEWLCSLSRSTCFLEPGEPLSAKLWNTYYYLALQTEHEGKDNVTLFDTRCQPLAKVSASYSDSICVEGSGRLDDGRVLNFADTCRCGRRCPTGGTICYKEISASEYPWGLGSGQRALEPLRAIAVDRRKIKLDSTIYLEAFDGLTIPSIGGVDGFTHDGCFVATDVGGWIKGGHIDIYAGTERMREALERVIPTETRLAAREGGRRCAYLEP